MVEYFFVLYIYIFFYCNFGRSKFTVHNHSFGQSKITFHNRNSGRSTTVILDGKKLRSTTVLLDGLIYSWSGLVWSEYM